MGTRDLRIDAYIADSEEFARPVLEHLRTLVHEGCPEVKETMKWSMPFFDYKGVLCSMASFKQHCAFAFWKGDQIDIPEPSGEKAMGQFGKIRSLADLPSKQVLLSYVQAAVRLNVDGVRATPRRKATTTEQADPGLPEELAEALTKNPLAEKHFNALSPSHQREYTTWISEAKAQATRQRRLAQTLEWLAEGKQRNWKYMSKKG